MKERTKPKGFGIAATMLATALLIGVALVPVAGAYKYSVTTIEDYSDSPWLGDLDPWGRLEYEKVEYWLHDQAGWSEEFYEKDDNVDEADFGTNNGGYEGLDDADFHYHLGHGVNDIGTELALHDWWPGLNYADVRAQDVNDKWDKNNEWVLLHSCYILSDHSSWGGALKYSHAILGFETSSETSTDLPDEFFRAAIDYDWTVISSYYHATKEAFDPCVTAAAITDTEDQWNNDRLHGQGTGASPDEYPDDGYHWYASWGC